MKPKIVAFVPLKRHSDRLKNKNLKPLGGKPLYTYILKTLAAVPELDEIYIYSSDPVFLRGTPKKIKWLKRPVRLDSSSVKGMQIYREFCSQITADIYVLAHATSPFLLPLSVSRCLQAVMSKKYDSALTCRSLKTYVWYKKAPLNFNPKNFARTQNLSPLVVETSGCYVFTPRLILKAGRRTGDNPFFCEISHFEMVADIDTRGDFELAQALLPGYQRQFQGPEEPLRHA